jgi:hypothetical protein
VALDEALANIGSMQERAASAQRKVWQGKVGKLQAALKNASAAAAGYRDEAKELRAQLEAFVGGAPGGGGGEGGGGDYS